LAATPVPAFVSTALTTALQQLTALWFGYEFATNAAWGERGDEAASAALVAVLDELLPENGIVARLTAIAEAVKV
jgi:hypothetical protein